LKPRRKTRIGFSSKPLDILEEKFDPASTFSIALLRPDL